MNKRKDLALILLFLLLLILGNCQSQKADVVLDERITIKENCTQISNQMANEVFEDMQEFFFAPTEDRLLHENPRMKIYYEREKDGMVWETVRLISDWKQIRDSEDHPLIIGMRELQNELLEYHNHPEDAQYAEQVIDGWLLELNNPDLAEGKDSINEAQLAFRPGEDAYTLYFHFKRDEMDEMIPLEEYSHEYLVENTELQKLRGREYVWEALYKRYTYGDLYKDSIYGDLYEE